MKDLNFKNWTDNFGQSILSSTMRANGENHVDDFLNQKLRASVIALDEAGSKIHQSNTPREFYWMLCVFIQEARNCMYWYERSLEYEQVNLSNSHLIINHGKSMIDVLDATLRVIKFQENLN
jgi:hypothetical protein